MKKVIKVLSVIALGLFLIILGNALGVQGSFQKYLSQYKKEVNDQSKNLSTDITQEEKEETLTYTERIEKGDTFLENGYSNFAIKEYEQAIKIASEKIEAYIKLGKIYFSEGQSEKAFEYFREALKQDPESIEAKINLGKVYMQKKDFNNAKVSFESIVGDNQTAVYYRGLIAAFMDDREAAKGHFKKAIEISTTEETSKNARRFLDAYEEFESSEGSEIIYLQTLLAKVFNQVGEYDLALKLAQDVVKEKNDYRDAWILLGYACLNKKDYECALNAFLEANNLDSEKAETQYFLGLTFIGLNKNEEAAKYLKMAIENGFEPQVEAKEKLAQIQLEIGQFREAAENYEDVRKENPENLSNFTRPIWIYIEELFEPEKALNIAQEAIQTHPENAMSFNLLGWALLENERYREAEQNLKYALQLDPNLSAAYLNLGQLAEKQGLIEKAKEYYKKAHSLATDEETAVKNLAAQKYNEILKKEKNPNE
ncbi:tetratricopeptide repeat protein [Candidatus Peregrinibacteria bacterium]|nr:tetratricopeptide repeat protein [Candidatus Peregrinibacteria bacterium]